MTRSRLSVPVLPANRTGLPDGTATPILWVLAIILSVIDSLKRTI